MTSITTSIDIPIKHVLVWVQEGSLHKTELAGSIEATTENLAKARYKSERWLYDRFNAYLGDLGVDTDEDGLDHLRSFVQMITHYDFMLTEESEREEELEWLAGVMALSDGDGS